MVEEEEDEDRAQCRTAAVLLPRPPAFDSSPVQESPFSNYLNSLSPIKPAKVENVGQTFQGINSSPLVFASPTISSQCIKDHLKRSGMFESPNDERKDDPTDSSQKSKELVTYCGNASDDVNKELSDSKHTLGVQSSSASRIADAFLADPFEADCAKSTRSSGRQGNSISTSDFDREEDTTKGSGREGTDLQNVSPARSYPDADELFSCDEPAVGAEYRGAGPSFSVRCDVSVGDLPIDDDDDQSGIDPVLDIKEGSHFGTFPTHVQPPCDPFQDSEVNENPGEDASGGLRLLDDDTQHHEVMHQQRFLLRRCLRFDDTFLDDSSNSPGPLSNDVNSPGSLAMEEMGNLELSEVTSTCIKTSASSVKSVITGRDGKHSAITTSKPSGIGLHLNSIVGARSIDSKETTCMKHDNDNQGGRDSIPVGAGTGILLDKTATFPHDVDPFNFTNAQELYGTPHDKRTLPLGFTEADFSQITAKRRRKASNASDTDGCKRCSCKKSRCLKLYCDCFAAGLFCTEPCACQGCLNRFEEQDTVLAARELIESRNPLAFAPKIVHSNKELDATIGEDGIMSTPSSSRHKKGCNCKKSMCQKKYCECYQANVGCSDNCRCEGCKNVFGTKEDFSFARDIGCRTVDTASLEGMSNVKLAMGGTYSRDHLMPPTPSFQFSDRKGLQRSRLAMECLSPNSSVKSAAAGWSREMQSEVSKESSTLETIANFLDSDFGEKADEFSPKHDSLGGSSNLAPLSSPTTMKSSSESSKTEPIPFTIRLGGGHLTSRFLWRGRSLETPGIVSAGEKSHLDDNPSGKVYRNLDDDAPGVPKDIPAPTKPVIVSSPNRKRVSSPHKQVQERRLTPSTTLRSGGKFILKAVPSFPPLTPLVEHRNNKSEPHGQP